MDFLVRLVVMDDDTMPKQKTVMLENESLGKTAKRFS
jgi:hypothetical protein